MAVIDLAKIDKNMGAANVIEDKSGYDFYSVDEAPFRIYGVEKKNGKYRRLEENFAQSISRGVGILHTNTAGGRIRFTTNSPSLAFLIKCNGEMPTENGAYLNRVGLDVYADGRFYAVTRGGNNYPNTYYEAIVRSDGLEPGEKTFTVYMPNYGEVHEVYIGIEKGSTLGTAPDYKHEKPVVYYGSSITQGGCASRPGNSYPSIIERMLNTNYINLGFSGNAKAEPELAEYIAKMDMSVFVYDYDHNAPSLEHLLETHEPFYKRIREENPNLPIIMISMPKYDLTKRDIARYEIIKRTYDNAIASGDKNVYLIFGKDLLRGIESDGLADGCHPNDLGFYYMAKGIAPYIKKAIEG